MLSMINFILYVLKLTVNMFVPADFVGHLTEQRAFRL